MVGGLRMECTARGVIAYVGPRAWLTGCGVGSGGASVVKNIFKTSPGFTSSVVVWPSQFWPESILARLFLKTHAVASPTLAGAALARASFPRSVCASARGCQPDATR